MATTAPATTPPASLTSTTNPSNVYGAIPGLSNLLGSAAGNIGNLLTGLPSPSYAQTLGAYAGATAGQPGQANQLGTFAGNQGLDLYQQQAEAGQQTGLSDLMNLIGTTSGTLAPSAAQNQSTAFNYAQLGQQGSEFQSNLALQQFMDAISAMSNLGRL